MARFCPQCGTLLEDTTRFCHSCGAAIEPVILNRESTRSTGKVGFKNILDNVNITQLDNMGVFTVLEHKQDLSSELDPIGSYFRSKMNVRPRQVLISLHQQSVKVQAGAMQWFGGNIVCDTGLGEGTKAIGNFIKGVAKGLASGETAVKPRYTGTGFVMLEPTYKHIILVDVAQWQGGLVLQDGLFLACDEHLQDKIVARNSLSGLLAGEGLFNLCLSGNGIAVLESPVPYQELYEFEIEDSELKIDGNMAIAWSSSLDLTVERSSKGLIGSMVNGEGLVNVYRGTGKVLMAPVVPGTLMDGGTPDETAEAEGGSATSSVLEGLSSFFND